MQDENLEVRIEENTEDGSQYIDAIKGLREEIASEKAKNEALRRDNKNLLDSLVNGQGVDITPEPKKTMQELIEACNDPNKNNLELTEAMLEYRKAVIEQGGIDPFVPHGHKYSPSQADFDRGEKVAAVLQDMVDIADGNNDVFLRESSRRIVDNSIPKPNNRRR